MRVPYSWLAELLPGVPAARELEPVLARLGLPVEEVLEVPAPPPGVVFAVVLGCEPIEGTSLRRLEVDLGDRTATIVTGAPNARAGVGVAVARPGARLPVAGDADASGFGLVVAERVIQGVPSFGMACSPRELGVGEHGGGLLELPADEAVAGAPLAENWAADVVLDVEVTPNRADALSVLGIARDLAAALGLELREPSRGLVSEADAAFPVRVELAVGCDRLVVRAAQGVRVGPSPAWVQRRLFLCGARPINNVVDASNVVMFELGQPTAAYDARDLPEDRVVVRAARAGERVRTLDETERELTEGDLVIATRVGGESRVMGVAGVVGAQYSSITGGTERVVVEAAHFDPVRVRLTARGLGVTTDAAYRFERGVDPNLPVWAADRFMELLALTGGPSARVLPGRADAGAPAERATIELRPAYLQSLLGELPLGPDGARGPLERLGCEVNDADEERLVVRPPTYRMDLRIEEDLIEEVARLVGYDMIGETLPALAPEGDNLLVDRASRGTRALKDVIAGLGFQEVVTYAFTSAPEAERSRAPAPRVLLRNPPTSERTALRTALYPSLLGAARANRGQPSLMLFEVARVFPEPGREEERLALLLSGPVAPDSWTAGVGGGFFALKGLLEAAAARLGDRVEVRRLVEPPAHLHPGVTGEVVWNGYSVGEVGALHPAVTAELELDEGTFVAELQLPLPGRPWSFIDPSRHPAAVRDLAVVAPAGEPYAVIARLVLEAAGLLLESVEPFDVYAGAPIPAGSRSVAVRLTFRAPGRTLTDAEVDAAMRDVIAAVRRAGYGLRD